jgi:hypothetical protein
MKTCKGILLPLILTLIAISGARAQVNITTWGCDLTHSGVNPNETILNVANVSANGSFGLLFTQPLDGQTYGQPLYASGITVGATTHNLVYVCTEHDSIYAFDGDNNSNTNASPIWHDSLIPSGAEPVPQGNVGSGDISVELGITTTPVIDLANNTIYIVSKVETTAQRTDNTGTYAAGTYQQYLHALNLATGAEEFNGPVLVNPTFSGTASDGTGGVVPFSALHQHSRAAMTLYNNIVYISYASHSDTTPYHGEILGYNASTLAFVRGFISTPNGSQGGIWGGGAGPAIDSNGNMFVTTANGNFDIPTTPATTGPTDFSESFLKLPTTGTGTFAASINTPSTFFTPNSWATLNQNDWDVGSGGVCLLPTQAGPHPDILVGGGKGHVLYVVDRDNLGGYNATTDSAIQEIPEQGGDWIFTTPSYFFPSGASNGYIYYAPSGGSLEQRAVVYNSTSVTTPYVADPPTFMSTDTYAVKGSGCFITANGTANGLVWMVNGSLRVHSATNVTGNPLYTFNVPGSTTKFQMPTVANGKAYITGFNTTTNAGSLYVLGLVTQATSLPAAPTNLVASTATSTSIGLTWTDNSNNESGFVIQRSTSSTGTFTPVITVGANTTFYTDTNLASNTTYYYQVLATNNLGNSAPTNTASAKTFNVYNPAGLVGYWNFDEGTGTTATDITANGHTGTITGEVNWTAGEINTALNFHGTGHAESAVTVPNAASLQFTATQSFTISAWVNPAALPTPNSSHTTDQAIISKSADQGNEYGLYINANDQWVFRGPSGDVVGPTAVQGVWTHVAGVQDGVLGVRSLYVNGVLVATGAAQDGSGAGDLWIAQQNLLLTAPDSYPGAIDEVRVYNIPLTATQITTLLGPPVLQAVSNQTEGTGTYSITLQPSTTTVVEPREGSTIGQYTIVMNFAAPVSGITGALTLPNGSAAVGSIKSITYDSTNTIVTVVLTGVANVQAIDLHLSGIVPGNGTADIPLNVLWGDVNADSSVSSVDASLDTTNAGVTLSNATCIYDINCDGVVNAADVSLINGQLGTTLGFPSTSNLALLQPASGSTFQTGNTYANGNDGNTTTTRWAANGPPLYPSYWQVDLGATQTLQQAVIYWFISGTRSYEYNIELSNDPAFGTFTTPISVTNNTTPGVSTNNFPANSTGRYVRVNVTGTLPTANSGNPSAYEFQMFGIPGAGTAPVISQNLPTTQAVTAGQSTTFSVGVSGTGTVNYQWQKNGANIYGATGSSYTIPLASAGYAGSYSVVVTDAYGTTTSGSLTLTVNALPTTPASPSDTPTMPPWALAVLALLFAGMGLRYLSPRESA